MTEMTSDEAKVAGRRIIEAADSARREVARDLHDGAQQQLVICLTQLRRASHKWSDDADRAKELLDSGVEAAEAALTGLRELAAGIHPTLLIHHGVGAAVEELARQQPLPVAVDLTEDRFPPSFEASVYFFVSEALTNVVKHAEACRASVRISADEERITVEVADDGVGGAEVTSNGVGLPGLAERVEAFGGELTITSDPESGTTLFADLPVTQKAGSPRSPASSRTASASSSSEVPFST